MKTIATTLGMRPTWKSMATAEETHRLIMRMTIFPPPIRTPHEKHLGPMRPCYTNLLLREKNECTFTGYRIGQSDIVA